MSTKILYVCTFWGVRSQIAKLLTDDLNEPGLIADSAGFETGKIGGLPREIMNDRGIDLPSEAPDTLFKFARNKIEYDYVITLCNQHTQENYSVLFNVVDTLFNAGAEVIHWNIPDFMSIQASGDARRVAAEKIVSTIESEVHKFVRVVRERHLAAG